MPINLTDMEKIKELVTYLSRYLIIILMVIYTVQCYTVLARRRADEKRTVFLRQNVSMFCIHLVAFAVMFVEQGNVQILLLYAMQALYLLLTLILMTAIYPRCSRLLLNNMCMLLTIGFIMITRLSYDSSVKQFKITVAGTVLALIVPVLVRRILVLTRLGWAYIFFGIGLLGLVLIAARVTNGARLSLDIAGYSFQPSEFVKIIFVFGMAGLLTEASDLRRLVTATVLAAAHVVILVVSKDLGSALIFFVAFLVMLFVSTHNPFLALAGILSGAIASVGAYYLFSHVRVRVNVWLDPFSDYANTGYQISQSLFSIAAGGWLGTGLGNGSPASIPYVQQDFMFSAICEELGCLFGLCLILVCASCFIMIINVAMKLDNRFYRLVALGLGTTYATQIFLTIGGGIKLIPLTGVTLPLVSYGGSSVLSTLVMFAIVQGLYTLRKDEKDEKEKEEQRDDPDPGSYFGYGYRPEEDAVRARDSRSEE